MHISMLLTLAGTFAASMAAVTKPRGDPTYDKPTCGINGSPITLDHDGLANATTSFASWVDAGADGKVDASGLFHGTLGVRIHLS